MDLEAKIRNIKKVCTPISKEDESEFKINIPFYQRAFKWDTNRIATLFEDFFNNYKKNGNVKYFAGALVTVKYENGSDDINKYDDIIDGQQRLTVLYLLIFYKFLLLRKLVAVEINKNSSKFGTIVDNLVKTIYFIFTLNHEGKKSLISIVKKLPDDKDNIISKNSSTEYEERLREIYEKYCKNIGLPICAYDSESFEEQQVNLNRKVFNHLKPGLTYSRSTFNEVFVNFLINTYVKLDASTGPKLECTSKIEDEAKKYFDAIETIHITLDKFCKERREDLNTYDPISKTNDIVSYIDEMLKNLEFCVIQTKNQGDAYTLFEVLNDRSLALDDLDLMKNLFYKFFYEKNKSDLEMVDKCIENLEEIWGDQVFNESLPYHKKERIKSFGTIFITGKENLIQVSKENYRDAIDDYLKNQYSGSTQYKESDIRFEFFIFLFINKILDKFEVTKNTRTQNLFMAETDINKSITYRTIHLLNALDYNGIMAALINLIIYIFLRKKNYNDWSSMKDKDFENEFDNFLENLKKSEEETKKYSELKKVSKNIWKLTLFANDYKIPLEYTKEILKENNLLNYKNGNDPYYSKLEDELWKKAKEEFEKRILASNQKTNDVKLKVLFINLYNYYYDKTEEKLKIKGPLAGKNIKSEIAKTIQLDHFEPEKIDSNMPQLYFNANTDAERKYYINMVGNFVLIPKKENIIKSNMPIESAKKIYEDVGLPTWFIDDIYSDFKNYTEDGKLKPDFFTKRSDKLSKYFIEIVENI